MCSFWEKETKIKLSHHRKRSWLALSGLVCASVDRGGWERNRSCRTAGWKFTPDRRRSTAGCPACWAMGQKNWNGVRWGEKYFVMGQPKQPRAEQNSIVPRHDKPNEPTKDGPLSFVLFESPFTSVSTVNRGHPSLVFLVARQRYIFSPIKL